MAQLIQIGNSLGVRLPKPLIKQAHFQGIELEFHLVDSGILISPKKNARDGWQNSIVQTLKLSEHNDSDSDWLDMPLNTVDDWEW